MKAPDAFQSAAGKAATWISGKQKAIVAGVVGALAVVAIVLGVMGWMDSRKSTAGALLYRTLDDADGQISSVPLPGVSVPIFASAEAQYRAVLGRADELRKAYPSTEAARTAALAAAAANLRLAAWDAAIADYEAYLAQGARPRTRSPSSPSRASAAPRRRRATWPARWPPSRSSRPQTPARADRAALERARLLAKSGKPDEARKLLQAFPQDFKESQLRPEADAQLAALGGTR